MDHYVQAAVINFLDFRDGRFSNPALVNNEHSVTKTPVIHPAVKSSVPRNPFKVETPTIDKTVTESPKIVATASVKSSPFSQKMLAAHSVGVIPVKKTATAPLLPLITTTVVQKVWRIPAGTMLQDGLTVWAAEAPCLSGVSAHWTIQWMTPVRYRIDAPVEFKGDFDTAVEGLFRLYQHAQRPLYAGRIRSQCLLMVDDKELK